MRKAILLLLAALLLCGAACAASAEEGFAYEVLEDGTASITECTLTGDVVIPSTIDGYTVTNLVRQLFFGNFGVTSVTIPATVAYFGDSQTDNMWDYVFSYAYSLKAIRVEEGNPAFCSVDGVLFSKDMTKLINYPCAKAGDSYHVPAAVTNLCCTSFASCQNLKSLYLENEDAIWFTYTFYNDSGLTVYYKPGSRSEMRVHQFDDDEMFQPWDPDAAETPAPARVPGDINGDGEIDIMDVIRQLKYVSDWNVEIIKENADVTGDGNVDIMDVIRLLKYVSGWSVELK